MNRKTKTVGLPEITLEMNQGSFDKLLFAINHVWKNESRSSLSFPKILIKPIIPKEEPPSSDGVILDEINIIDDDPPSIIGTAQPTEYNTTTGPTRPQITKASSNLPSPGVQPIKSPKPQNQGGFKVWKDPVNFDNVVDETNKACHSSQPEEDDPIQVILKKIAAVENLCPANLLPKSHEYTESNTRTPEPQSIGTSRDTIVRKTIKMTENKDSDRGKTKRQLSNTNESVPKKIYKPRKAKKVRGEEQREYNYTEIADPKLPILKLMLRLLHHPETNPEVMEWVDQKEGIFRITNTKEFAKFRGKQRNGVDYLEFIHINRTIRYHAAGSKDKKGTGKLYSIPGQRLTYQFTDPSDKDLCQVGQLGELIA